MLCRRCPLLNTVSAVHSKPLCLTQAGPGILMPGSDWALCSASTRSQAGVTLALCLRRTVIFLPCGAACGSQSWIATGCAGMARVELLQCPMQWNCGVRHSSAPTMLYSRGNTAQGLLSLCKRARRPWVSPSLSLPLDSYLQPPSSWRLCACRRTRGPEGFCASSENFGHFSIKCKARRRYASGEVIIAVLLACAPAYTPAGPAGAHIPASVGSAS